MTELLDTLSGSLVRLHRQYHPTLSLQLGQYPLQVIAYISRYTIIQRLKREFFLLRLLKLLQFNGHWWIARSQEKLTSLPLTNLLGLQSKREKADCGKAMCQEKQGSDREKLWQLVLNDPWIRVPWVHILKKWNLSTLLSHSSKIFLDSRFP